MHLSISNDIVCTKIYDKRDDFDFEIVNFPFLDGDVPRSTSYGVYISQLIRAYKPYKARFVANSSSCTTTELSKLLTSCLTAVKNMLSSIVKRYMRDSVKTYFGLLKIQVKF